MASTVHVILNPAAGGGSGRKIRPELERELARRGVDVVLEETREPGHAIEMAREAASRGVDAVVAAGGDGTVHEVVNGILAGRTGGPEGGPVLGVVPIGTGNDFIKVVAGGTERMRAYDVIARGDVRWFDVGRVEWDGGAEYFMNGVGTGIDVEVVRQIRRLPRLPGVVSYLAGLVRALIGFEPIPLELRLDGETLERRIMIIVIGNGICVGGGFYVCPAARPDDGKFDVCIVDELNVLQIAQVLPRVLRGTHGGRPEVTMRQVESVEIVAKGAEPLFFQLDGELREPPGARWFRVGLERAALPVLAHGYAPWHTGVHAAAGEAATSAPARGGRP